MIKINGEELLLNKNKGFLGELKYEQMFGRELSDDIQKVIQDGTPDKVRVNKLTFFRLALLMSGKIDTMSLENFVESVGYQYNFMNDYFEVLKKASDTYLPYESPNTEETKDSTKE